MGKSMPKTEAKIQKKLGKDPNQSRQTRGLNIKKKDISRKPIRKEPNKFSGRINKYS